MEILDPLGLSVTKAAKVLSVTRPALSAVLNGRAGLSPDMALRVEKAFGVRMDTLLRMQTAFEIAEARNREANIKVKRYVPKAPAARAPVEHATARTERRNLSRSDRDADMAR
jgi:addiction module HigA family antidote